MTKKQTPLMIFAIGSALSLTLALLANSLNSIILSSLAILTSLALVRHSIRAARRVVFVPVKSSSFQARYAHKIYLS